MRKMVEQQGGQGWQELQSLTGGSVAGGQNLTVVWLRIQRHLEEIWRGVRWQTMREVGRRMVI